MHKKILPIEFICLLGFSLYSTITWSHLNSCDGPDIPRDNPIDVESYPDTPYVDEYMTMNGTPGRLYMPMDRGSVLDDVPLVIILHAQGYAYNQYDYLQEHLAKNGIASASIEFEEVVIDQRVFERSFEFHLQHLYEDHKHRNRFDNKISVVGHSRGGGHAVWAPKFAKEVFPELTVKSVVGLAPNTVNNGNNDGVFLTDSDVRAYLLMYAAEDDEGDLNGRFSSAFISYDQSGYRQNEWSYRGQSRRFYKSSIYLKGADHESFLDGKTFNDPVKGYILAFLRWSLISTGNNRENNIIYFRDQVPIDHSSAHNRLSLQYSHGPYRRVLDNFENSSSMSNTLGGRNYISNIDVSYGASNQVLNTSPHESRVALIKWPAAQYAGDPYIRFKLPDVYWTYYYSYYSVRDISNFSHLTFRVGQNNRTDTDDIDFTIMLRSYDYWTRGYREDRIKVSDVGVIPGRFATNGRAIKSVMNTIAVPLCKFEHTDLNYVYDVTFEFDVAGSKSGEIQIDSLEFIKD